MLSLLGEEMMLQRLAVLVCTAAFAVACAQTDAGVTTAVKSKLAADDTVKAYQIDVDTHRKVVTLTGEVQTTIAKDQALKLARETDGVRDVVDKLTVTETAATTGVLDRGDAAAESAGRKTAEAAGKAGAVVTDAALTSAVKAKLLADPDVSGLKIDVDTSNGVVTLTGNVSTQAEADEAIQVTRTTEGVRDVVSKLRVTAR
jgi:hyperosmotically inducible periplasmic protein